MICEVDPTSEHPEGSVALAVIGRSDRHYHVHATETYEIIRGTLRLNVDGKEVVLSEGESYTIEPKVRHFAASIGEPAWVMATSRPGWRPDDHILEDASKD